MRLMTAHLHRLAHLAQNTPHRVVLALLLKTAGMLEDQFARASYIEGLMGYSPGTIVGRENSFFPEARKALKEGRENRITTELQNRMADRDVSLMIGNRDTGIFAAFGNGVRSVMKDQSFRGWGAEDVIMATAGGISVQTGRPFKKYKGGTPFHWLGSRAGGNLSVGGLKSISYKEGRNRALDLVRDYSGDLDTHISLNAPLSEGEEQITLQDILPDSQGSVSRADYVDLAAAIYQDPWVMQTIDKAVRSNLRGPVQEAVWESILHEPGLLKVNPNGVGVEQRPLAKAVAALSGTEYKGKSSDVAAGSNFRKKVYPAMISALDDPTIANRLMKRKNILKIIQEATRRPDWANSHKHKNIRTRGDSYSQGAAGPAVDLDLGPIKTQLPRSLRNRLAARVASRFITRLLHIQGSGL